MRDLSYGSYSHADVINQLAATNGATGSRFELLDLRYNKIEDITTVLNQRGAAVVDVNVDRQYIGGLHLQMLADEVMRGYPPLTALIRPWFRLRMPKGDIAEWPMGIYLWNPPQSVFDPSQELWTLTLPDQSQVLDFADPGDTGFRVDASTNVAAILKLIFKALLGDIDLAGIADVGYTVSQTLAWFWTMPADYTKWQEDLRNYSAFDPTGTIVPMVRFIRTLLATFHVDNSPVTFLKIVNAIATASGYQVWFDWAGKPRAVPAPNLATVGIMPDEHFSPGPTSVLITPVTTTPQVTQLCNFVAVRPATNDAYLQPVLLNANDYFPAHPFIPAKIGRYVRKTINDSVSGSQDQLKANGLKQLGDALAVYQTVLVPTLAQPHLEPFDIAGLQMPGHPEFGTERPLQVRTMAFDLFDGASSFDGRRLYQ